MIVTPLAASVLGVLYVVLALKIVQLRRKYGISIGYGSNDELHRTIRAHANLTEYAPILLILLAVLEFNGAPVWLCALLALPFLTGRLLHARAMFLPSSKVPKQRVLGMQLTLYNLLALCLVNVLWLLF